MTIITNALLIAAPFFIGAAIAALADRQPRRNHMHYRTLVDPMTSVRVLPARTPIVRCVVCGHYGTGVEMLDTCDRGHMLRDNVCEAHTPDGVAPECGAFPESPGW